MQAPTVFRDGLLRGQVEVLTVDGGSQAWGEFWPLGKPDYFKLED